MSPIGLFNPNSYTESINLFFHLLGIIYFFVFIAQIFQIKGLIGKDGILPLEKHLLFFKKRLRSKKRYFYIPTIFWMNCSDEMLMGVAATGALLGLVLFLGGMPCLILPFLIILHLSVITAGQDFWGFGWEGFLLEISYSAFFLSLTEQPNLFVWISLNLLLFRFHFEAGTSKLESRDPNWRNLTALKFHYQSQPLPNTLAWYVYKLPLGFHKFSTFLMFFIELVIPFFALFGTQEIRLASFFLLFGLQFFIYITGNFSYLNHLTAVLTVILISNAYLEPFFGNGAIVQEPSSLIANAILTCIGIVLISLQIIALWNHYAPTIMTKKIMRAIYHFHIANRYGIFAVMTTKRYEIVIEGSDDKNNWKEYGFFYKSSEINRRPRRISPYQPRIDWQAWFLPFESYNDQDWFESFLTCLLKGSPEVLKLLHHNPFKEKPPRYIRAQIYLYEFSDYRTKKQTGAWWKRELIGDYSPTFTLNKPS